MLGVVAEDFLSLAARLSTSLMESTEHIKGKLRPELGLFAGTELRRCPSPGELGKEKLVLAQGTKEFSISDKPRASVCVGLPAHPDYPTGYAGTGRTGDLEEAARRTTMSAILEKDLSNGSKSHPLAPSDALYVGSGTVLRGPAPDFAWLRDPVSLPMVAVCKPAKTSWVVRDSRAGEKGLRPTADAELRRACYAMCRSCLARGHDVLVIGRCFAASESRGVPALSMARAMRQVVATYFPGCFRLVLCAALPTPAAEEVLSKAGWGASVSGIASDLREGRAAGDRFLSEASSGTTTRVGSTAGEEASAGAGLGGSRLDRGVRKASTASERSAGAASILSSASGPGVSDAAVRSPGRSAPPGVLSALAGSPLSAMGSGVSSALGSHSPAAPSWVPQSSEHVKLVASDPYLAFRHVWLGSAGFVPSSDVGSAGGWGLGLGLGFGLGAGAGTERGQTSSGTASEGAAGGGGGGFRQGYVPPSLPGGIADARSPSGRDAGSDRGSPMLALTPMGSASGKEPAARATSTRSGSSPIGVTAGSGLAAGAGDGSRLVEPAASTPSRIEEVDLFGGYGDFGGQDDGDEPVL